MKWILNNTDVLATYLWAHLWLTLPAVLAALVISVPLGWLAHRNRRLAGLIITGSGLLYAIPSLPLLIVLPMLFGFGLRSPVNVMVALTLYGVALLVRPVAEGFDAVPVETQLSATALGYSRLRRFFAVQLPLTVPFIISGLRVVAASTVALCTIGAVLGISSLGTLFTDGLARKIVPEVVAGLVLTIGLAAVLDVVIVVIGRIASPWKTGQQRMVRA